MVTYLDISELLVEPGGEIRPVLHGRDFKMLIERVMNKAETKPLCTCERFGILSKFTDEKSEKQPRGQG